MFTAQLGVARSEPGNIELGLGAVQGVGALWQGPFFPADLYGGGTYAQHIQNGQRITVPPAVASQMMLSDPSWWVFG